MRLPGRRRRLVRPSARRARSGATGEVPDRLGGRRPMPRGRPGRRSPPPPRARARAPGWGPPARRRVRPHPVAERHAPALLPAVARPRRASWSHTALHRSLPVSGQRPPLEPHPSVPAPGVALHPPVDVRPPRGLQPARPALLPGDRARRLRARSPAHGRSRRRARRGRRRQPAPRAARALVRRPSGRLRACPRAGCALGSRRGAHARTARRWRRRGAGGSCARHAGAPVHVHHAGGPRRARRDARLGRANGLAGVDAAHRVRALPSGRYRLGLHAASGVRHGLDRRRRTRTQRSPALLPGTRHPGAARHLWRARARLAHPDRPHGAWARRRRRSSAPLRGGARVGPRADPGPDASRVSRSTRRSTGGSRSSR